MLEGDKIDYKSASKGVGLEVPPDLTQLSRDSRYTVPGGAVTASSFQVGQAAPGVPTAASTLGDVRIERAGTQRWLVVNRSADQLWGPVRDFWQESGFLLALDQASLGIMETDWAENRAKIPQDFIRSTLGKLLDSVYSTSERDRFRTRLERSASGGTEIYVSHRGMIEVYSNTQKDQTVWQPRATDPELEAEFLRRLMVKLGVPQEQSKALVATGAAKTHLARRHRRQHARGADRRRVRPRLAPRRAWRWTAPASRWKTAIAPRAPTSSATSSPTPTRRKRASSASCSAARKRPSAPLKYRINLKSQGESTTVSVLNASGAPESSANAQRIVQVIADDLK